MSSDKKPDFSNVQGGARSSEATKPDFGNVQSKVTSTEEIISNTVVDETANEVKAADDAAAVASSGATQEQPVTAGA